MEKEQNKRIHLGMNGSPRKHDPRIVLQALKIIAALEPDQKRRGQYKHVKHLGIPPATIHHYRSNKWAIPNLEEDAQIMDSMEESPNPVGCCESQD